MISARYETLLFQFLISAIMSCLVSATVSLINLGFDAFEFLRWFETWMIAWSVAFPSIVITSPVVGKIVKKLIKS